MLHIKVYTSNLFEFQVYTSYTCEIQLWAGLRTPTKNGKTQFSVGCWKWKCELIDFFLALIHVSNNTFIWNRKFELISHDVKLLANTWNRLFLNICKLYPNNNGLWCIFWIQFCWIASNAHTDKKHMSNFITSVVHRSLSIYLCTYNSLSQTEEFNRSKCMDVCQLFLPVLNYFKVCIYLFNSHTYNIYIILYIPIHKEQNQYGNAFLLVYTRRRKKK